MRKIFTFLFSIGCLSVSAQTVCGTVGEGATLTLTAPPGMVFNSIVFASYGTPTGSCGSYTTGGCHAATSSSVAFANLIGQNSGSIGANNGVFGDPCVGTAKILTVEASYAASLPLSLTSFSAQQTNDGKIKLQWLTTDELGTDHFVIERSTDGRSFETVGIVSAQGMRNNSYDFTASPANTAGAYFYRLKTVDKDGRFSYSNVLRLNNTVALTLDLTVFPNPAKDIVTISGLTGKGQIRLLDTKGMLLQQITTGAQTISLTMNISKYPHGIYVLQFVTDKQTISQKLLK